MSAAGGFMQVRTASLQQRPHTHQGVRPPTLLEKGRLASTGALDVERRVPAAVPLPEWIPNAASLAMRPHAANRARHAALWASASSSAASKLIGADVNDDARERDVVGPESSKCKTPLSRRVPAPDDLNPAEVGLARSLSANKPGTAPDGSRGSIAVPADSGHRLAPGTRAAGYGHPVAHRVDASLTEITTHIHQPDEVDGAVYSKILQDDRDRQRRELDGAWRREKALQSRLTELQQQVHDSRRRDAELHRQMNAMLEAVARADVEKRQLEAFAVITLSAHSSATRIASLRTTRPPVKDSEMLRALKRAEARIAQLETDQSKGVGAALNSKFSDDRRPGTTPAIHPHHTGVGKLTHHADIAIRELEREDSTVEGKRHYRPFITTVIR